MPRYRQLSAMHLNLCKEKRTPKFAFKKRPHSYLLKTASSEKGLMKKKNVRCKKAEDAQSETKSGGGTKIEFVELDLLL